MNKVACLAKSVGRKEHWLQFIRGTGFVKVLKVKTTLKGVIVILTTTGVQINIAIENHIQHVILILAILLTTN